MAQLHIPLELWRRMDAYAKAAAPNEVTGIGVLQVTSPDCLVVTRLFLPKQLSCPSFCEFREGELNQIIFELIQEDPAQAKMLCFRWHSHADGAVFWSSRDEHDIASWKGNWVANLVLNTSGEYLARLDFFRPLRVSNVPLTVVIDYPMDERVHEECAREVALKVSILSSPQVCKEGSDKRELFGSNSYF